MLKCPPSGPHWARFRREGKDHKLWLMHWLIEEASDQERAVVRRKQAGVDSSGRGAAPASGAARLGGMSESRGGRRADP